MNQNSQKRPDAAHIGMSIDNLICFKTTTDELLLYKNGKIIVSGVQEA